MLQLIRSQPGLLIVIGLLVGGAFVCTLVGLIMARAGASLRPVFWFAGFFALIVLPQLLGHSYQAMQAAKTRMPGNDTMQRPGSPSGPDDLEAGSPFGPDVDRQLITDVREAYGEVFKNATEARFAILPGGDTVLLARFDDFPAAEAAWIDYLRVAGWNQLPGEGDSHRGYAVTRPTGDRAYALAFGNQLGIWTGQDDAAIRGRIRAGGFEIPARAPLAHNGAGNESGSPVSKSPLRFALLTAGISVYAFFLVLYFFKGAAWAGSSPARPGIVPVSSNELASRLESINELDVPFRVERGARPDQWIARWRNEDAHWVDLARARGLRRTFRIRLTLDESKGTVRATDEAATYDWSAGLGGANLEWKSLLGIVFFQYESQSSFGLGLDEQGRFTLRPDYQYTFDLNEMKSPLVETVTRSGWAWRPTVWQGPAWLRWLTE